MICSEFTIISTILSFNSYWLIFRDTSSYLQTKNKWDFHAVPRTYPLQNKVPGQCWHWLATGWLLSSLNLNHLNNQSNQSIQLKLPPLPLRSFWQNDDQKTFMRQIPFQTYICAYVYYIYIYMFFNILCQLLMKPNSSHLLNQRSICFFAPVLRTDGWHRLCVPESMLAGGLSSWFLAPENKVWLDLPTSWCMICWINYQQSFLEK